MNELHDRLKNIISHDRYRQGVGELAELTGRGCGFDTMACVFSAYYPEQVLPRVLETDPIKYSPDLGLEIAEFVDFIQDRREKLGYEVERAVLAPGMIPIATGVDEVRSAEVFKKHLEKISWASVQIPTDAELSHDGNSLSEDMFGIRRAILESTEPMAAFMSKANGEGHIEPMLGNRFTRQEVLAELKKEGYRLIGYCVFSKVE